MQFRSAEEIKNQANQEYKSGHYAEAIRLYSQAIGKPIPFVANGPWYLRQSVFNFIFVGIIATSPNTATYYANRAAALTMIKKYKEAADDCRVATNLDPDNFKAYLRAGKCHMNLGNLEEASRLYQLVLSREPSNIQAQREAYNLQQLGNYIQQAEMFMANKQWGLATNSLDRAIAFTDGDAVPFAWRVWRAECALGQKNHSEATRLAK